MEMQLDESMRSLWTKLGVITQSARGRVGTDSPMSRIQLLRRESVEPRPVSCEVNLLLDTMQN